ncbi:Glucose-1-phosphate adenylyltransferase large subunit 1, partial [Cucurbita argyrosperma subsp. sororia]
MPLIHRFLRNLPRFSLLFAPFHSIPLPSPPPIASLFSFSVSYGFLLFVLQTQFPSVSESEWILWGETLKLTSNGAASVVTTLNITKEAASIQAPPFHTVKVNPKNVASIILGGGAGTHLFPLTRRLATPAVLAATQTPGKSGMYWFQGTADAVRQFIWVFEDAKNRNVENILILAGDHMYRMDYMDFVQNHVDRNADISISCAPVDDSRASDYGLVKLDSRGRIIQFSEKPKGAHLNAMRVDTTSLGLSREEALKSPYIASMGVYVFKTDVLLNLLKWRYPTSNDFGSEIIPAAVKEHNVQAFVFRDYWEDIGTIRTFYEANLALTEEFPKFEFYDPKTPFYTSPRFLPPTKIDKCQIVDAIISHGCFLRECSLTRDCKSLV